MNCEFINHQASFREALDHVQELLERQLALVRQGRLDAALTLCEQVAPWVQRLAETGASERHPAADQWEHVERLYRELSLALTAQRTETSAALEVIRQGRRMLQTYSRTGRIRR